MNQYGQQMDPMDIILADHCYYSRGPSHECHLIPTKTLFSPKSGTNGPELLDVTSVPPQPNTQYDHFKALELMEECKRFVIFARVPHAEDNRDDWETTIERVGWTQDQTWLFEKVTDILHSDRLARLALDGTWSEPAKRRAHVDRTAERFRNAMATIAWDVRLAQWLHGLLIEHLDVCYLAAYVDILQTLKVRIPSLVERLLAGAVYGKAPVVQEGMNLLLKRPWDPAISTVNSQKPGKLPDNAMIVLIPSSFRKSQPTPRCNVWSTNLCSLGTLYTISPPTGLVTSQMTPTAYLEEMVSATKTRIANLRASYPGRPLFLVGWRSGAAVALQTAVTELITAVVSLGFSTRTVEGPRGDPDDSIYSITCPVLFVTGEHATTARPEDLEEIRMRMGCSTEQVVVGKCDDCLRMSRRHRIALGVTQCLVDRAILETVGEFLANALLKPGGVRPRTPPSTHKRLSSEMDSEYSSALTEAANKLPRLLPAYKVNGVSGQTPKPTPITPPSRRGRKPGSLKSPKRPIKTIQTLSPIKRASPMILVEPSKDVDMDVGTLGSLGTTITRSGSPSASTTSPTRPGATFRIQAGRVAAASVPLADVVPPRLSDSSILCEALTERKNPAIMTLTPLSNPQRIFSSVSMATPRQATLSTTTRLSPATQNRSPHIASPSARASPVTNSVAARPRAQSATPRMATQTPPSPEARIHSVTPGRIVNQSNRPAMFLSPKTRFGFTSSSRSLVSHANNKNYIRMTQRRPAAQSPGAITTRIVRTHVKGTTSPPVFSVPKRFPSPMASSSQAKPVLMKSRIRQGEEVLDEGSGYALVTEDSDIVMVNRSHGEVEVAAKVGEPKKQSALVLKERPKQQILYSTTGEKYIVQDRRASREDFIQERTEMPTYIVNYQEDDNDTLIYEVIEG